MANKSDHDLDLIGNASSVWYIKFIEDWTMDYLMTYGWCVTVTSKHPSYIIVNPLKSILSST